MAEGKNSFLLYKDLIHVIRKLKKEDAGELFIHILQYVNDEEPVTTNPIVDITFEPIKQTLKRNLASWMIKIDERSISGRVGNLKRWHNDLYKQYKKGDLTLEQAELEVNNRKLSHSDNSIANVADSVSVSVSVSDSVIGNKKENIDIREKKFIADIAVFKGKYTKDMLTGFYTYWSERDKKGLKMRFELQKTWDIKKRLVRWETNNQGTSISTTSPPPSTPQKPLSD